MKTKEIFILLPDGVGLRNFAFTSFVEKGAEMGWTITFWNYTPFSLSKLGFSEIKLQGKPRAKTDLLKRAKIEAELDFFTSKFWDPVYRTYKFPNSKSGLKNKVKNFVVSALIKNHKGEKGLTRLRKKMEDSERRGRFYRHCKEVLASRRPDMVFCTNQRAVTAIGPLTAARDLGIPTSTFIFSWDNLPKATMVANSDYYFVWSHYMAQEILKYYPNLVPEQIYITGSPQFEPYFDPTIRRDKEVFYAEMGLDPSKKYICFSGDDITTSPYDPQYLQDFAESIRSMNRNGHKLGIIFRRSPVDFSDRYDEVLTAFHDIIVPINPRWRKVGDRWNTILPTKEDLSIQINTIRFSELVVNIASSMVFDFAVFDKPCLYLNYCAENKNDKNWNPQKIYDFVHFRSMPSNDAVIWVNSKKEIREKLEGVLEKRDGVEVRKAQKWFRIINEHPPEQASQRIWNSIEEIFEHDDGK